MPRQQKNPWKIAEGLAKGLTQMQAVQEAGYAASTAQKKAYAIVKRPSVQSALTDCCERIIRKREMQFDEIVEPYFDALKAPLIVKSTQLGDAYVPKDPETQQPYPDHALRMDAADRLIDLYGGKPRDVEMPSEPQKGLTIIFQKEARAKNAVVVNPTGLTSIVPTGETKYPKLPVIFRKPNGHNGLSRGDA
jgi:hypothetical protein